jgi:hypothetical protein
MAPLSLVTFPSYYYFVSPPPPPPEFQYTLAHATWALAQGARAWLG